MYDFAYHRPQSLSEASRLLEANADSQLLAGGMTLLPTLKQRLARPSSLIDLGAVPDLAGIAVTGDGLTIGAMTSHAHVAKSADVKKMIPALAQLAGGIGDPHVRHRGTIGGSIANNDPAADYPAALLGLGATVRTTERTIAADDFFTGMFTTALEAGEIVTSICFPIPKYAAYIKFRNPASRYALVGVFVASTPSGVRVAVTGAAPCVFRQAEMERALAASWTPQAVRAVKQTVDGLMSDIHGTAEYRAHLVGVLSRRALESMSDR